MQMQSSHAQTLYYLDQPNMIASKSVEAALSLIKSNKLKVLGLSFGAKEVIPGQQIPKLGMQLTLGNP
jgi:hypothetical protein